MPAHEAQLHHPLVAISSQAIAEHSEGHAFCDDVRACNNSASASASSSGGGGGGRIGGGGGGFLTGGGGFIGGGAGIPHWSAHSPRPNCGGGFTMPLHEAQLHHP